ncbi:MAG: pyrroline-5-carboxylate reductase [Deltaproteobacteria bacterium]|nr:pyrroline-5-carboxylate reductase [Deltaproteobacteria bacterium]
MLKEKTICFLGAGNLAEALIKGLISSGRLSPGKIVASDKLPNRLVLLAERYEIKIYNENAQAAADSDIIFITVKPQDAAILMKEIAPVFAGREAVGKVIISAVAGVTTNALLDALQTSGVERPVPIVRAMPNTPVTVRQGATALCAGIYAGRAELDLAAALFGAVGKVIEVADESLMDAVTGLSGSGPAYVFYFIEALIEAGVRLGLNRADAKTLAVQTVLGAGLLASESDAPLDDLRRAVTSPGGTTMEGIKSLEANGFKEIVVGAVEAATKRAKELSGR